MVEEAEGVEERVARGSGVGSSSPERRCCVGTREMRVVLGLDRQGLGGLKIRPAWLVRPKRHGWDLSPSYTN